MSELESAQGGASAAETPAPTPAVPGEAEAWAAVLASWGDEAVHLRYLARFTDIEGLATAGGRYKAVLDERPGDEVAARMRGEVLRKATAWGLAALPRSKASALPRLPRGWTLLLLAVWIILVSVCIWKRGQP